MDAQYFQNFSQAYGKHVKNKTGDSIMEINISEKSFGITKHVLSCMYSELLYQRDWMEESSDKRTQLSDTAELIRAALKEIGVTVSPTNNELDKKGNKK